MGEGCAAANPEFIVARIKMTHLMKYLILTLAFFLMSISVHAAEWRVQNYIDGEAEGTLRVLIYEACRTEGDDRITFLIPARGTISISLGSPLVIPRNCRGRIHIQGLEDVDTKIEYGTFGSFSEYPGSSCLLNIYSDGNTVERLRFSGHFYGAGICLFGRNNTVQRNIFGERDSIGRSFNPNTYAVVVSRLHSSADPLMNGSSNSISNNHVLPDAEVPFYSDADDVRIIGNHIETSRSLSVYHSGQGGLVSQNEIDGSGAHGIVVHGRGIRVEQNQIHLTAGSSIYYEGAEARIQGNNIQNPSEDGIYLNGQGEVVANQIHSPAQGGISLDGRDIHVESNLIEHAGKNGIQGHLTASRLDSNQISESHEFGIAVSGENIEISLNGIGKSLKHGLFLETNRSQVHGNNIITNAWSGIDIRGNENAIFHNTILANGGCVGVNERFASQDVDCLDGNGNGGPGILIEASSMDNVIGGNSFDEHANRIQYNRDGGVILLGDMTTKNNRIARNTISRNYGPEPDLDLAGDGLTLNDPGDVDEGPNHLLNTIDHLQAFPLVPSPAGEARYWTWGLTQSGSEVQLYGVPEEDRTRGRTHGGGETYYGASPVAHRSFRINPEARFHSFEDQLVTTLTFDETGNTSEFSLNTPAGRDQDMDGIVDSLETGDGTVMTRATSATVTDSDGDGLPDSVEDANRNGRWDRDSGETSAYNPDTDGDGLNDWVETHGDGRYERGIDTDPFNPDTDGDGARDGEEDRNSNGVWDNNESSPLMIDSDNDGVTDRTDNCPAIPNPGQEAWYCGR